jgi:acyl-coenzyme A thioesterase PaaI-like protein
MIKTRWEDDQMCFACGSQNPVGMHLKFELIGPDGIQTEFLPGKTFQGYKNIVHGGILGLLLDEVMVNLPWLRLGQPFATAELNIKLRAPAPVGQTLYARAWPEGPLAGKRLLKLRGEIRLGDQTLIAEGQAICVKMP